MIVSHSQYYTSDEIASLLVKCISKENVDTILDLGAGNGALTKAAKKKWKAANFIVTDIDESNYNYLLEQGFNSWNVDCNSPDLDYRIGVGYSSIDAGVCNPPYETIENNEFVKDLLLEAKLQMNRKDCYSTSDLVFLAYNLLFLKPHGVLGIIIPYSIMTGRNFSMLRQSLLEHYYVERVIELPEKSFSYTEAKTGILIIRKEKSEGRKTKLNTVTDGFKLSDSLYVSPSKLALRLDYSYHLWRKGQNGKNVKHNNDITIVRGRHTHDELKKKGLPYFHSTSYNRTDIDWHFKYDNSEKGMVSQGCFLIVRVGKRCVGRVKYLEEGHIQISDCIYGLTVPQEYINDFKHFFQSEEYSKFVKIASRGVCAFYLCKGDLESMVLKKLDEFRLRDGKTKKHTMKSR